ncbi:Uncharacterised protein [uncultured archaeon]|nr:Uncharacterised protein [uncultured archaeon]
MILRKRKNNDIDIFVNKRFAFLPTRMKEFPRDYGGEWIWLESYIENISLKNSREFRIRSRKRLTVFVLQQLSSEKDDSDCQKDKPTIIDSPKVKQLKEAVEVFVENWQKHHLF